MAKIGWEPPADIQQGFDHYRAALATPDESERDDLLREVLNIATEGFYVVGTVLSLPTYAVKTNNFHNVPGTTARLLALSVTR